MDVYYILSVVKYMYMYMEGMKQTSSFRPSSNREHNAMLVGYLHAHVLWGQHLQYRNYNIITINMFYVDTEMLGSIVIISNTN